MEGFDRKSYDNPAFRKEDRERWRSSNAFNKLSLPRHTLSGKHLGGGVWHAPKMEPLSGYIDGHKTLGMQGLTRVRQQEKELTMNGFESM